jgi:L-threonylcarbamoyladenylate synthase
LNIISHTKISEKSAQQQIATVLHQGKVICYPTETVYGLGSDAFSESGILETFKLKERGVHKPILVLINSTKMLESLVEGVSKSAEKLMETFWPGPLTLVFKCHPDIPKPISQLLTAGTGEIGVRYSSSKTVQAIISAHGGPITSTSANKSGQSHELNHQGIIDHFGDKVAFFVDAGPNENRVPSTVVCTIHSPIRLIREGAILFSDVRRAIE